MLGICASRRRGTPHAEGFKGGTPFRVVEPQMEYFIYTTRMEEDGQASPNCERRVLTRLAGDEPSADWYTISYEPRLFEKQKFSVTLNDNGTLSSVATESTPISLQELERFTIGCSLAAGLVLRPRAEG